MMLWLLERLGPSGRGVLTERELVCHDQQGFERLVDDMVLTRCDRAATTVVRDGLVLSVEELPDGSLEATDDQDPEFVPVSVDRSEVELWQFDSERFFTLLRTKLALSGPIGGVREGVQQIGELARDVSVVFAFARTGSEMIELGAVLGSLLPDRYRHHLVIGWSTEADAGQLRVVENLGVTFCMLSEDWDIQPSIENCMTRFRRSDISGAYEPRWDVAWSADFRSVTHKGTHLSLTGPEAMAFRAYFEALRNDTPDLSDAFILEHIGSTARDFGELTRRWSIRSLIAEGGSRGTHRLIL